MVITWDDQADDASDPDYDGSEAQDIEGYRIYRAWPPSFDWHYGPWELVTDIVLKDENYYDSNTGIYTYIRGLYAFLVGFNGVWEVLRILGRGGVAHECARSGRVMTF